MLVFDSKTREELLKDVCQFLRQQAAYHQNSIARNKTEETLKTARANALTSAAMDLEGVRIAPIPPAPSFPVPHPFQASDVNPGTCGVCGKVEVYDKFHKLS